MVALTGVLACACGRDDYEKDPFGTAKVTLTDAGDSNVDAKPFVATKVTASVGRQCSGGFPGISKGDCASYLMGNVAAEGQLLEMRLWSDRVPDNDQARRVTGGTEPAVNSITLRQGPPADTRFWNGNSNAFERATVSVAADGRVTYEIVAVLEASKSTTSTGKVRVEASVTIDCKPDGPNVALCESKDGPPRE